MSLASAGLMCISADNFFCGRLAADRASVSAASANRADVGSANGGSRVS